MANPTLVIRELSRAPSGGPEDRLEFQPGVNLLVGEPNTGKTKWLIMLDYLLGDDGNPREKFEDLYEKYESAKVVCTIGGAEVTIERRWREKGLMTKAIVNDTVMDVDGLCQFILDGLGIKTFRFPQGNPYGSRTWPTLGWRGLVRHMYRRQKMWTDLADQQHESEQHACITQFLGIGQRLFSPEYADLVQKENKIRALEYERDQFLATLDQVTREIVEVKELGVAVTPQSLEDAINRVRGEIAKLEKRRHDLLVTAIQKVEVESKPPLEASVERLGTELGNLRARQEQVQTAVRKTDERLNELSRQKALLSSEVSRLGRAETATRILPKLKITHCPACDQAISELDDSGPDCFLCKRSQPAPGDSDEFARRAAFEKEQIASELAETNQLIADLTAEAKKLRKMLEELAVRVRRIEIDLQPVRVAVAAVLPPDLTLVDIESGRLQERLSQLERIRQTLGRRDVIAEQIKSIQREVADLERQVKERKVEVDFEEAGQRLQDGINTYLNHIKEASPKSWTQTAPIRVSIREREFCIKVGKSNWKTKLGGNQSLLFLLAYHHALLGLTPMDGCHYPGFAALDFPARMEDGSPGITRDQENFVVRPFIRQFEAKDMKGAQLIVAGNAFDGLEGVHRVPLTKVWVETEGGEGNLPQNHD